MGRYISTTGTAGVVTKQVNTTYQAVVNDRILADSSSATFTITLPLNASLLVNDTIINKINSSDYQEYIIYKNSLLENIQNEINFWENKFNNFSNFSNINI